MDVHSLPDSMDMSLSKLWERVKDRKAWHVVAHGVAELDILTKKQLFIAALLIRAKKWKQMSIVG